MVIIYLKRIFVLILVFYFQLNLFGQCVTGPPNVNLICGNSTTLAATTSAVTYSIVQTQCSPLSNAGTDAFTTNCDDCVTGQINIGFPFNFYGNTYSTAVIQSNGILGFGATFDYIGFSSFSIPALGTPNNYIAGIFADIDIRYGGNIRYQTIGTAPNRQFVVSYNNVVPYNTGSSAGTGTASFQIVLNETGSFQIIIKQFSANWNASTSGSLATSGAENNTGTAAFPITGRNATDWPGIVAADLDCNTFNQLPCVFQNWKDGATIVSTNPNYTASPTSTKTYTATWLCGGSTVCTANTTVAINSFLNAPIISDNTECVNPNGAINISVSNVNSGSYDFNYNLNGVPTTQNVTIGALTSFSQGAVFNAGNLSATDSKWNRNSEGTTCNGSAGTLYYYDVFSFFPSISGSYTFSMCTPGTNWDSHASIYQTSFDGLNPCATPSNFLLANDDGNSGGNCEDDSILTLNLTAGINYFLVSTSFSNDVLGNYEWTYTGPTSANISATSASIITLSPIVSGTFTGLSLNTGACGNINLPGTFTVLDRSQKTWTGTTSTDWNVASNWSNSIIPSASDCVYIPNTTNKPIISGTNYSGFAGNLTVLNNGILTVNDSNNIIVTDKVTVNTGGIFNLQNNSNLLQLNNVPNAGEINYNRIAPNIRGYDYVYWSSPVIGQNINNIYTTPAQGVKYWWNTVAPNANGGLGYWINADNLNMNVGQGYIMMGSSNNTMPATNISANFRGIPNNGNLTIRAKRGDMTSATVPSFYTYSSLGINDDNWSLLGNPYPSAINGLQFLSRNATNLVGSLYLWRHINNVAAIASPFYQNFTYNYNTTDYLAINFTGSTTPTATDIIKTGQAFMVQRKEGTQDLTGVNVFFNNGMRHNSNVPYANDNFFRNSNSIATTNLYNLERNRIWLDLVDDVTLSSETTLLGYVETATNNFDNLFDAPIYSFFTNKIYTANGNENFVIQARELPFNNLDLVPLAYNVLNNGNYKIAINTVDGIFNNQDIFLEDLLLNTTHDLKLSPYSFSSNAGNFNDRFILKYQNTSLSSQEFELNNQIKILTSDKISIQSNNLKIKKIEIFDLLGRKIDAYQNLDLQFKTLDNLHKFNNAYIIKTTLENDVVVNKKIIF